MRTDDGAWRDRLPVLVPEANAAGMIAVIRSLGRAGYPVHACARRPDALGLRSKYASRAVPCPDYLDPGFRPWLRSYLEENGIAAVIPSESFLVAVRPMLDEVLPLMPVPKRSEVLFRCISKCDYFAAFLSAEGDHPVRTRIPPTLVIREGNVLPDRADIAALGSRLYLKTDACHARRGSDAHVVRDISPEEALRTLPDLLNGHDRVLVQGPVTGRKACVNVCIHDGEVLARSMCLSTHENPHTGGLTTLRHTWWHEGMFEDAMQRLRFLEWNGVAMVEYKYDSVTGDWTFIELNARYWAALHLDLYAGTDFPRVQIDSFFGRISPRVADQPLGVRCRYTVPQDIGYVLSSLRDRRLTVRRKLATLVECMALFLDPGLHSDLLFPGDRNLYWIAWWQFVRRLFG